MSNELIVISVIIAHILLYYLILFIYYLYNKNLNKKEKEEDIINISVDIFVSDEKD